MKKALLGLLIAAPLFAQHDMDEHNKWMRESAGTIRELTNAGDKGIPDHLLRRAQCVAVIPNLKRAGFIVGAKYGKGVLTKAGRSGGGALPRLCALKGAVSVSRSARAKPTWFSWLWVNLARTG